MGFDRQSLARLVAQHGRVARVVIGAVAGSSPREVGAAMLVWPGGQSGTIGGGALELAAAQSALAGQSYRVSRHALGPELGQCCGGAVTLVTEMFDAARLAEVPRTGLYVRGPSDDTEPPLPVQRALAQWRGTGQRPEPALHRNWMTEPVDAPGTPLWIWGAGHVGRALVDVLAPLPDLAITWVDTGPERFPATIPDGVTVLPVEEPARAMSLAPAQARHLILTYSHEIDLSLCHAALSHGFAACGLIGSATKWARFRKRLTALGHGPAQIARITCPIGDPGLGKHPQAIAVGVAAEYLRETQRKTVTERDGDERHASDA